jgi:hypothetical protein
VDTLSLHDALPISICIVKRKVECDGRGEACHVE